MALELKTQRDGRFRDTWYGRYEINGQKLFVNLDVKVGGTPPASRSIRDEGDTEFERSRATAQAKLDGIVAEARSKRNAVALAEKIYEIKTGEAIKSVKLAALVEEWGKIPRRRKLNATYAQQCQSTVERFVEFVRVRHAKVVEVAQVSRTIALAFLEAEAKRGITGKTWNDKLKVLRLVFKQSLPAGCINPLAEVPTRETKTVFRIPFTPEELGRITEAAKADEFIRPIVVAGICSAMRRGDCCLLRWKDVDLNNRFITVKTSKTEQTVSIPIFPMLLEELRGKAEVLKAETLKTGHTSPRPRQDACATPKEDYVFPEQAETYLRNPDGITLRVKRVLARALCGTADHGPQTTDEAVLPEVTGSEVRARGEAFLLTLPASDKRERMATVFKCYMDGKSLDDVVTETGVSKTSVSGYLKEIEEGAKCGIVRGRPDGKSMAALLKESQSFLRADREGGTRRASVRDFHSFRVTWVTLALTAGVPLELVQKVTGHKTTDIVLKHYFQPGREAFREALQKAMPALLTNGQKGLLDNGPETTDQKQKTGDGGQSSVGSDLWEKVKTEMREILASMTSKTWRQDREQLFKMLKAESASPTDVVTG